MSAQANGPLRTRPFSVRLGETVSLGWAGLSAAILVILFAILALVLGAGGHLGALFEGRTAPWLGQDLRVAVLLSLILAYLPGVQSLVARQAQRSVRELAPVLDLEPDELERATERCTSVVRRTLRRACMIGLVAVAGVAFLPEAFATRTFVATDMPGISMLHRVWVAAIGVLAGSTFALMGSASAEVSALTEDHGRVDLFDLRPWNPLVRLGLTNAFTNAGLVSLILLFLPERDAGEGLIYGLLIFVAVAAVLAGIGLILPLIGLRSRIRAEKRARLDACHKDLAALMSDAAPETGRLGDLVAYRNLLDGVSEWPLDLPQVTRFALLFVLPLFSWVAAAMVERLLDALIG